MTPNEIRALLRAERLRAGLSLQGLADKHGVKQPTLRSHEVGDRSMHLGQLVEHAGWLGLEVVLLPADGGGRELFQRGYDQAVAQVAELFGLPVDAEAMRRHNQPRPGAVDWDAALADAYDETEQESTDA